MARIKISEQDNTTSSVLTGSSDIVYIPGFCDYATMKDISYDPGTNPITCSSIDEFQQYFGTTPPTYTATSTIGYAITSTSCFSTSITYQKGDYDSSYIIASELINSGMTVCYEKVNQLADFSTAVTSVEWTATDSSQMIEYTATISESQISSFPFKIGGLQTTSYVTATASNSSINLTDINVAQSSNVYALTLTRKYNTKQTELTKTEDINLYYKNSTDVTAEAIYEALLPTDSSEESILDKLKDRGTFQLKYITTGGYPAFEYNKSFSADGASLAKKMLNVAGSFSTDDGSTTVTGRGDAIALIDHVNAPARNLIGDESVDTVLKSNFSSELGSFGAMFTPWCKYSISYTSGPSTVELPGSYAYLKAVAKQVQAGNDNWFAIANIARGAVTTLGQCTNKILTNSIANQYQKDVESGSGCSQNAITYVYPYGYCIWGNRTLVDSSGGVTASGFLNTRSVLCDVKKVVYNAAKRFMFEPNTETLWINFSTQVSETLEKMKISSAISDYSITKDKSKSAKTKLYAKIVIYPVYAVETFDISIELNDEDVTIEGA